ncbi:hypothetical protein [Nocardia sp. NPDC050710]
MSATPRPRRPNPARKLATASDAFHGWQRWVTAHGTAYSAFTNYAHH